MIPIPLWLVVYVAASFVLAVFLSLVLGEESSITVFVILLSVLLVRHAWKYVRRERQESRSLASERWIKAMVRTSPLTEAVRRLHSDPEAVDHLNALDPMQRGLLDHYLSARARLETGAVPERAEEDARLAIDMYEAEQWEASLIERMEDAQRRREGKTRPD